MVTFRLFGYEVKIDKVKQKKTDQAFPNNDIVEKIKDSINMHSESINNTIKQNLQVIIHKVENLSASLSLKDDLLGLKNLIDERLPEQSLIEATYKMSDQIGDICNLITEIERFQPKIADNNMAIILEVFIDRLLEILQNSGCKTIKDEFSFDIVRHQALGCFADDGTQIKKTVRAGVEWNGSVFLRAKVIV